MKEENERLIKTINLRVDAVAERLENEIQELERKREIISADKACIELSIEELEELKREAVTETWERVNTHLNDIFSTLLVGTEA